jgi:hypothetical protein
MPLRWLMASWARLLAAFAAFSSAEAHQPVWPAPRAMSATGGDVALAPDFAARSMMVVAAPTAAGAASEEEARARLARAAVRFGAVVAPAWALDARRRVAAVDSGACLRSLDLQVDDFVAPLGIGTDSSYTLTVSAGQAVARSATIYGAMYAMETFAQLVHVEAGVLTAANVTVSDSPSYQWRGLMVDTGRRFAPVALLHNLIDTMAAVKLNVLHMHMSDFCRFAVESKLYPNLTASLTGINAGFYSQNEIKALLAYAKDRGVRVVPEFEMPGHALGFKPISAPGGLEFCAVCAYPDGCEPSQLKSTPGTFKVCPSLAIPTFLHTCRSYVSPSSFHSRTLRSFTGIYTILYYAR